MMPKHRATKRPVCYECARRIWPWQYREWDHVDAGEWAVRHWSMPCPPLLGR